MRNYIIVSFIIAICIFNDTTYPMPDDAVKIAQKYGIDSFSKISQITFTFNVHINSKNIKRVWKWNTKTNEIIFINDNFKYNRNNLKEDLIEIDHKFINDSYWFLFPFHLIWDNNVDIEKADQKVSSPIKNESLNKLTVKYMNDVGYTPNDIYELYYDDDFLIKEWVYIRAGSETIKRAATWENNKVYNGILISENHRGNDNFRLWFTDIQIK